MARFWLLVIYLIALSRVSFHLGCGGFGLCASYFGGEETTHRFLFLLLWAWLNLRNTFFSLHFFIRRFRFCSRFLLLQRGLLLRGWVLHWRSRFFRIFLHLFFY